MANSLTLTEAADLLAPPVIDEKQSSSFSGPLVPTKKGELTIEEAASLFGAPVTRPKKQRETTVEKVAQEFSDPAAEIVKTIPEARAKREDASLARFHCAVRLQAFLDQIHQAFAGWDEAALRSDVRWHAAWKQAHELEAELHKAEVAEKETWERECDAEGEAFMARRPDFQHYEGGWRIVNMLEGLGVSQQEIMGLWQAPEAIDIENPACRAILAKAAGSDDQDAFLKVLRDVGFEDDEIEAVSAGNAPVYLRDHRIQELVARALDADAHGQDRKAA